MCVGAVSGAGSGGGYNALTSSLLYAVLMCDISLSRPGRSTEDEEPGYLPGPVSFGAESPEETAVGVAAGSAHSLARVGGHLYGWGWNKYGQIGLPAGADRLRPDRVELPVSPPLWVQSGCDAWTTLVLGPQGHQQDCPAGAEDVTEPDASRGRSGQRKEFIDNHATK